MQQKVIPDQEHTLPHIQPNAAAQDSPEPEATSKGKLIQSPPHKHNTSRAGLNNKDSEPLPVITLLHLLLIS